MSDWNFTPPTPSKLLDHDVPLLGEHLKGKRIALMVCGGIAAMKAPLIARGLRRFGAQVVAYVSSEALKYTTIDSLEWATTNQVISHLSPRSEHLSKESPFDAYVVAPATYNTINKFRYGIADTVITTTLAAALGELEKKRTQILIAPTMHGDLHTAILTESMKFLNSLGVEFIPPRDDYGKHNIPETRTLVSYVCRALSVSNLRGHKILVTAGPTPTPIDRVRQITNRFRGRLGIELAQELWFRGADVKLILGSSGIQAPSFIDTLVVQDFDEYKNTVVAEMDAWNPEFGLFSAAVADYKPKAFVDGKIPSNGALKNIEVVPTEKVIDLVQNKYPKLKMISFKYLENVTLDQLFGVAHERLDKSHMAVVANRGEDMSTDGRQVAYMVSDKKQAPQRMEGKRQIAASISDFLESKI